jgi:hypothetical protein
MRGYNKELDQIFSNLTDEMQKVQKCRLSVREKEFVDWTMELYEEERSLEEHLKNKLRQINNRLLYEAPNAVRD